MKLNIKTPLSFQKKILFLVALGSFCLISYFLFFFDAHLTSFLQSHFNAHGPTEVHIKGLKTNLFLSRLRVESLSFRDLYENKKRKVKLTGLEGDFELLSLLQKKTIIENLFIKDVFFEKEGPQNASLSKAPLSPMRQRAQEKSHKTLDRLEKMSPLGLLKQISPAKDSAKDSPLELKDLGALALGGAFLKEPEKILKALHRLRSVLAPHLSENKKTAPHPFVIKNLVIGDRKERGWTGEFKNLNNIPQKIPFPTMGFLKHNKKPILTISLDYRTLPYREKVSYSPEPQALSLQTLIDHKLLKVVAKKGTLSQGAHVSIENNTLDLHVDTKISQGSYQISCANQPIQETLHNAFHRALELSLTVRAQGPLTKPHWSISTNLGPFIEKSAKEQMAGWLKEKKTDFENEIQKKITSQGKEAQKSFLKNHPKRLLETKKKDLENLRKKALKGIETLNKQLKQMDEKMNQLTPEEKQQIKTIQRALLKGLKDL